MKHQGCLLVIFLCAAVAAISCSKAVSPPPFELTYRDSLVGAGKIVQIENTSNATLEQIEVRITAPGGEQRSYTEPTLAAYASLDVGWKRLGGWEVAPGAEIEVRCKGYLRATSDTVPE